MENLFSARLREEAARANPGTVMWPPMEHQGIIFAPHPQFMIPMEPLTPTEHIPRRRESGHELISPVTSTRCRSVETPAIHPRARTPDQGNSKLMSQQRSSSLTDVYSWSTAGSSERHTSPSRPQGKPSPNDSGADQVKSYGPFTALINVAAGARPLAGGVQESPRGRDSLKTTEAERSHPQFTRQSCVVTNTSVLHVAAGPKDTSQAHGISSGLAPPQPPPLLSITGTQPSRSEGMSNPRLIETHAIGRMGPRDAQDSPRVVNPRDMINPREPTATFSHSPKEQHPPPLVRDTPPLRRTPPTRDVGVAGRSNQDLLPCGCRSTEPCKHQLYSQEVPYVQRVDARNTREVDQPVVENTPLPSREVEPRKTIFRPWTEDIVKDTLKTSSPLKTVSPPIQLKQTGSSLHSQQPQKRLSGSPLGGVRTPSPSVISHPYSQQPGVLIAHPNPLQQMGEVVPRSELHSRSSHPQEGKTPKPSLTPQGTTPQPSSSASHLTRQPGSSSVLHQHPDLVASGSRSPLAPTSTQPNDPFTLRNLREPSIIKSPHPPPLMSGVHPSTPQHNPTYPLPYFPHHFGASHPSQTVLGMPYPFPQPSSSMPHNLLNQPTIQEPRGPSTLIQGRDTRSSPFLPVFTSQHNPLHPDLLYSGNISHFARDSARLPHLPFGKSRPSSEQSRTVLEQSRALSEQPRTALEQSRTLTEQSRTGSELSPTATKQSGVLQGASRFSGDYPTPAVSKSISPRLQSVSPGLKERPKSPCMKQPELHQPGFDAPVDIQRQVNPSYTAKTDDVIKFSASANNQGMQ